MKRKETVLVQVEDGGAVGGQGLEFIDDYREVEVKENTVSLSIDNVGFFRDSGRRRNVLGQSMRLFVRG
jgi:hypothetical protein